jgi:hypothetical protein
MRRRGGQSCGTRRARPGRVRPPAPGGLPSWVRADTAAREPGREPVCRLIVGRNRPRLRGFHRRGSMGAVLRGAMDRLGPSGGMLRAGRGACLSSAWGVRFPFDVQRALRAPPPSGGLPGAAGHVGTTRRHVGATRADGPTGPASGPAWPSTTRTSWADELLELGRTADSLRANVSSSSTQGPSSSARAPRRCSQVLPIPEAGTAPSSSSSATRTMHPRAARER